MTYLDYASKAYQYILDNGYEKGITGKKVLDSIDSLKPIDRDSNLEFLAWAKDRSLSTTSDYFAKVYALLLSDVDVDPKYVNYICSAIDLYLRNIEQEKKAANTKYVGNIGDTITFEVTNAKIISTRYYGGYYNGNEYYIYILEDKDGNVYKIGTSKFIDKGDIVTAKIKDHSEFRNEKQTVLAKPTITHKQKEESGINSTLLGDLYD